MAQPVIDFSNFGADLMRTVQDNGGTIIVTNAVMDGVAALRNDFATELTRDRALLLSAEFIDAFKAASQSFTGQQAMVLRPRYAEFTQGDIDLEITFDDIQKAYRSYAGWIMEPTRTEADVRENPFELFFVRRIIAAHFMFVRQKTSWKGIYNPTPVGAENIADGLLKKTAAGRASGEIKASHVFTSAAITVNNAYDQVNGVANLITTARPDLLSIPLNYYISQTDYDLYRKNRRTLFKEHVGPADKPTTLDDYTNITFVIDPGLAGKNTKVITPKDNLKFIANEAPGQYSINIVKQVKSWQISIRVSVGFDYASPELLFLNDAI
ncbi:hypothetical protein [Spirosoma oryzicola]|uniref:hypothetical protein n=1 Tax=Spirosoma oryzicola TaxID=2898794 RepID=UPI001E3C575B|nr:hypothetical protein [Spirosoma oryzicola]UHG93370.1 hypothetical protein LQ777_10805 [Spirosoma oryzicola]